MYDEMNNNMEEYPMDQELEAMMNDEDNLGDIHIFVSRAGGSPVPADVQAGETIGSVIRRINGGGNALGLGTNSTLSHLVFTNKRTHVSTPDPNTTIGGLGLSTGDVLTCTDDGTVA